MKKYRFKRSRLSSVLAALFILAIGAAAIIILPQIIKEDNPGVVVNTPDLSPEPTPTPTMEPTPRAAYIPDIDELTAIPAYDQIQFSGEFASAEFNDEGVDRKSVV